MNCDQYPLPRARVVAIAKDGYLTPKNPFPDPTNLPGVVAPMYGQDLTSSVGRAALKGQSVGTTPIALKPKMEKLLTIFASGDRSGMARRLFTAFWTKQSKPTFFDDAALNAAALKHPNIKFFCDAALSAPNLNNRSHGKVRIHQALKAAGWDINKMAIPTDLGVPAFDIGSKKFATDDFDNGLGVMINGVQYVYVVAQNYYYDAKARTYCIKLRYIFYDVFGLDDDDLDEFGASSDGLLSSNAAIGITAWWQLQHQHGYAPLVTRIIFDKTYESPAT